MLDLTREMKEHESRFENVVKQMRVSEKDKDGARVEVVELQSLLDKTKQSKAR